MIFPKSVLLFLICGVPYSTSTPICYCKNGVKSWDSINPNQCECSMPTGSCGDNVAHVPAGDLTTYAEATGKCGNMAHANGAGSRAVVKAGKLNKAVVHMKNGVAEIDKGRRNTATSFAEGAVAKVIGGGLKNTVVANGKNCESRVENGSENVVTCNPVNSLAYVLDADSCQIWTWATSLSCSIDTDGVLLDGEDRNCEATVSPTTPSPTTVSPSTVSPTTVSPTTDLPTTVSPTTTAPTTTAPTTPPPTSSPPGPYTQICSCKNGIIMPGSSNPSQCKCSMPTGSCGDNAAYVPAGDLTTYAEATGECGNMAHAIGAGSRAVVKAGKMNTAVVHNKWNQWAHIIDGVAEIDGGEGNTATSLAEGAVAKVIDIGSYNNVVANSKNCESFVEDGSNNVVTCNPMNSHAYVLNADYCQIWTWATLLSCSDGTDGVGFDAGRDLDCED